MVFTPEFFQNPYPTYAHLRRNDPVARTTIPFTDVDVWLVSRFEDVRAAFADNRLSSDYSNAPAHFHAAHLAFGGDTVGARTMLNLDAPDHTRVRKLAAATFTERRVAQWQETIAGIVDGLLDAVPAKEPVDVLDAIAAPLSVRMICTVLGTPPADSVRLRAWGDAIFTADPGQRHLIPQALDGLIGYSADLIAAKRRAPADDLLTELIEASGAPGLLTGNELLATVTGLVVAGYESTIAMVGDLFLALIDHPDQLALLRQDPSLADAAIEVVLRYDGPQASSFWRFATEGLELAGTPIAAQDVVVLLVGSAHRDPARYPDPDTFHILREDKKHLAFGHGIHRCLGSQLARRNTRTLLTRTLERFSSWSLAIPRESVSYKPNLIVRGPAALPVTFDH
ncbi:cytochrome P450 family protein [Herbidospora yilanensis]|uniref:cytochrome P450 family protein n=1 Tax=Herbidospora yilanensis TaxID=354426 RepID=UPI0007821A5E|nr:cytochrome P450 [Herbidospora yilanensis]